MRRESLTSPRNKGREAALVNFKDDLTINSVMISHVAILSLST